MGWRSDSTSTIAWNEERIDLLKKLWADGLSASQVAKQLGGVTRSAVLGKVHRLGLAGRGQPSAPKRNEGRAPRPPKSPPTAKAQASPRPRRVQTTIAMFPPATEPFPARAVEEAAPAPVAFKDEAPGTATILTLGRHACKWPIGDPRDEAFTLCGRRAAANGRYCDDHATVAFKPTTKGASATELARSLRRYL